MKILLCQVAPSTGDLTKNVKLIQKHYRRAQKEGANICVFPELILTGYLAEDLFLTPSFIKEIQQHIDAIVKITGKTCLLLPTPIIKNKLLYNGVIAARNGKIIGQTFKNKLPNYGVFDESRYFLPGEPQIFTINEFKFGVPICEDIWSDYVCNKLKALGAEILISINSSPFEKGKMLRRVSQVKKIFKNTKTPILYCNQVAAQDGIIFDGKSFCFDGSLNIIGKPFEETIEIVELSEGKLFVNTTYNLPINPNEEIYRAMVMGVKSYVHENNFSKVILGLSGGIDSAMVAAIAVDALGASNVSALMLPSKFTSKESISDAEDIASRLKIPLKTIAINDSVECLAKTIDKSSTEESSIMYQNLQSRIRGIILMAESNKTGALLLTTGNKSEYATGYATIYGDMNGAFNPIKDVYKTELYELARYKNVIPQHILNKAPSAELTLNQKDSDSLPEYSILDKILEQYIEYNSSKEELSKQFKPELVDKVLKLVKNSEFKRRQSAPGVKISTKNFEKDRRFPITNHYDG
tara:strand:+ start:1076 stop:2650 length:1575 start_codon:yes stop_codon:yes gene_type:complete